MTPVESTRTCSRLEPELTGETDGGGDGVFLTLRSRSRHSRRRH